MADRFVTPKDITDYFDQKSMRPAFSWLDVWGEEHAHAFTVAKATEAELLGSFHRSLSQALKEGQTFETWKAEIEKDLMRQGWYGPRRVADPLGEDDEALVDFSSRRRLKTIFDSNMRSARAAGQWQRIQRSKRSMPFILYVRSVSAEPRAEHLQWAGVILPVDDPFWQTHFPPNGWGCKCAVRSVTRREAARLGYDPAKGGPQVVWRTIVNRRTGAIAEVPKGIDRGWHTNPGLARSKGLTDRLALRLQEAGPEIASKQVREFWQSPERKVLVNIPERGVSLPAAVRSELADELEAKGPLVSVFADTVKTKTEKKGQQASRSSAFDHLNTVLSEGEIVDEKRPDARIVIKEIDGRWWGAAVQKAKTGFLRVISFYQIGAERALRLRSKKGE